jgi:hypothetical protein
MKDAIYDYSGTQYDVFRAWETELFMKRGHYVTVD